MNNDIKPTELKFKNKKIPCTYECIEYIGMTIFIITVEEGRSIDEFGDDCLIGYEIQDEEKECTKKFMAEIIENGRRK